MNALARWAAPPALVAMATGVAAVAGVAPASAATQAGIVGGAGVIAAVAVASARPELQVFGTCVCRAVHPGRCALTFDDGPHPDSTPLLLETLAIHRSKATFFVLADRVRQWPSLARDILEAGHEIGLHGRAHHPWLTVWSPARGAADLREAIEILEGVGARPVWFRPPFGVVSPRVFAAMRQVGLTMAWCSVRTGDGGWISAETLKARCRRVVGTDIVLMHEGPRHARNVLKDVLCDWEDRGIAASSLVQAMEAA